MINPPKNVNSIVEMGVTVMLPADITGTNVNLGSNHYNQINKNTDDQAKLAPKSLFHSAFQDKLTKVGNALPALFTALKHKSSTIAASMVLLMSKLTRVGRAATDSSLRVVQPESVIENLFGNESKLSEDVKKLKHELLNNPNGSLLSSKNIIVADNAIYLNVNEHDKMHVAPTIIAKFGNIGSEDISKGHDSVAHILMAIKYNGLTFTSLTDLCNIMTTNDGFNIAKMGIAQAVADRLNNSMLKHSPFILEYNEGFRGLVHYPSDTKKFEPIISFASLHSQTRKLMADNAHDAIPASNIVYTRRESVSRAETPLSSEAAYEKPAIAQRQATPNITGSNGIRKHAAFPMAPAAVKATEAEPSTPPAERKARDTRVSLADGEQTTATGAKTGVQELKALFENSGNSPISARKPGRKL